MQQKKRGQSPISVVIGAILINLLYQTFNIPHYVQLDSLRFAGVLALD